MGTNRAALLQCLELSRNISALGVGINSKRAAKEIYAQLVDTSADLGASITSVDYVPMRSQRTQAAVDSMRQVSKVIYLLNVAGESGYFVSDYVAVAMKSAVKLSELLVDITATYDGTLENNMAAAAEAAEAAEGEVKQEENLDPDGFDAPYEEG